MKRVAPYNSIVIPRFFLPSPVAPGASVTLPDAASHHALRVLRLGAGDEVVLFDGRGGEYPGRIVSTAHGALVKVLRHDPADREARLRVVLAQVIPAGDRMDWLIQKAVEIGVAAIVPLSSRRGVVRLSGERAARRREHWAGIALGACEQCGRNRVPDIRPILDLPDFLAESMAGEGKRLVLEPDAQIALGDAAKDAESVTLLIGPEGGFDEDERRAAQVGGFQPARLGPRVLRSETAGIAGLCVLLARAGDL